MTCKHDWHFIGNTGSLRCQRCNAASINWRNTEVMRISKDGILVNPDVPVDEAAKKVLEAIDHNIKWMVDQVRKEEREACARIAEEWLGPTKDRELHIAQAIRARGQA